LTSNAGFSGANTDYPQPARRHSVGGSLYFDRHVSKPFQRNPAVVKELEEAQMLQEPDPKPGRKEEVRMLCRKLGLRE
jgi:hypothetical protein